MILVGMTPQLLTALNKLWFIHIILSIFYFWDHFDTFSQTSNDKLEHSVWGDDESIVPNNELDESVQVAGLDVDEALHWRGHRVFN